MVVAFPGHTRCVFIFCFLYFLNNVFIVKTLFVGKCDPLFESLTHCFQCYKIYLYNCNVIDIDFKRILAGGRAYRRAWGERVYGRAVRKVGRDKPENRIQNTNFIYSWKV